MVRAVLASSLLVLSRADLSKGSPTVAPAEPDEYILELAAAVSIGVVALLCVVRCLWRRCKHSLQGRAPNQARDLAAITIGAVPQAVDEPKSQESPQGSLEEPPERLPKNPAKKSPRGSRGPLQAPDEAASIKAIPAQAVHVPVSVCKEAAPVPVSYFPPKTLPSPANAAVQKLEVGARVKAKYTCGSVRWYSATVAEVRLDGYLINWDDGHDVQREQPFENVRAMQADEVPDYVPHLHPQR